jgi:predicted MFS family arabinose efflux permease
MERSQLFIFRVLRTILHFPAMPIAICGLLALAVANGIGRFAFTPILPLMQEDADVSVVQGGWLASANYLGYLIGALWAMLHRVDRIRAVRVSLLATGLATLAMAFADGMLAWLALRWAAGVSSAWALIHVTAWCLDRLAAHRRPLLNGIVFAGVGAGVVVAGLVCVVLMSMDSGFRSAWLALGAIALLVAGGVWPVFTPGGPATSAGERMQAGFKWSGDAVRLVFCYGAFGLGYIIPGTFIPVMAKRVIHDPLIFGWAWPVFGLAAAASTLFAVPLLSKLDNRSVWRAAASAMALGVVSPLFLPGLTGIVLAAVLVGGTFMVITMVGMQEARRVAGTNAGVLIAALTSAFAAGQIAGPLLVSYFAGRAGGFSAALWLACGFLVLSVVFLGPSPAGNEIRKAYDRS